MGLLAGLTARARLLKNEVAALYLAGRDRRTPLLVKLMIVLIVAYALSPIDLIPDFIPVIGLLDDVILVPLAIAFVLRLIPREVMAEARLDAPAALARAKRWGLLGLLIIVAIWIGIVVAAVYAVRWLVSGAR